MRSRISHLIDLFLEHADHGTATYYGINLALAALITSLGLAILA